MRNRRDFLQLLPLSLGMLSLLPEMAEKYSPFEPTRVMRAEHNVHAVPDIGPFRMMVLLFGQQRHPGHEAPGGGEVREAEFAADRVTPLRHAPVRQGLRQGRPRRRIQSLDHGDVPLPA